MRRELHNQSQGLCGICREYVKFGRMTIDHIIPLSRGGISELANFQPAHSWCNHVKGNMLPDEIGPVERERIQARAKPKYHNRTQRVALAQ